MELKPKEGWNGRLLDDGSEADLRIVGKTEWSRNQNETNSFWKTVRYVRHKAVNEILKLDEEGRNVKHRCTTQK